MSKKLIAPWAAIIVAAGQSTRLKSRIPKPFLKLDDKRTLLDFSLASFKKVKGLACVVIVTQPDYLEKAIHHLYRHHLAGHCLYRRSGTGRFGIKGAFSGSRRHKNRVSA